MIPWKMQQTGSVHLFENGPRARGRPGAGEGPLRASASSSHKCGSRATDGQMAGRAPGVPGAGRPSRLGRGGEGARAARPGTSHARRSTGAFRHVGPWRRDRRAQSASSGWTPPLLRVRGSVRPPGPAAPDHLALSARPVRRSASVAEARNTWGGARVGCGRHRTRPGRGPAPGSRPSASATRRPPSLWCPRSHSAGGPLPALRLASAARRSEPPGRKRSPRRGHALGKPNERSRRSKGALLRGPGGPSP